MSTYPKPLPEDRICGVYPLGMQGVFLTDNSQLVTDPVKFQAHIYNERTNSLSGPFASKDICAVTVKDNSSEMYAVTRDKKIIKTDLVDLNDPKLPEFEDPFTQIEEPPDPDFGQFNGIICSKTGQGFHYRHRVLPKPFEDPVFTPTTIVEPLYFRDCHLAIMQTNFLHLGDEHNEKQVYRTDLSFHKNSCGHLWLYVRNDDGLVKGQYKGAIKEHMKVFTNLRGRRFQIKMLVATHKDHAWAMRDMAIGYNIGKSF